jgi:DNA ligase-associated metallophosphoesterase
MIEVEVGGEPRVLLAERCIWWPAQRALLVADAHIGKAASFRRLGVPVPRGSTSETLSRLSSPIERHAARQVVFLGDFLHSRHAHAAATQGAAARWRALHPRLALTLVRGNHDDRAGDPPPALGITCVDEPWRVGGLALCHHPQVVAGAYALAGHLHPCTSVGRGFDRLRLACFHFGANCGVLPAFGAFTGMHPIAAVAGDRVYVVADDRVAALPSLHCA